MPKRPKSLLCVVAFAGMALAGCDRNPVSTSRETQAAIPAGQIGSRLPEFSVRDLQGHEISSSGLRGKVVLIDFWATWCEPCKKEMPGYQHLADRYAARGFAVIGLKFDTMADTQDPIQFARIIGVRYPLAVASEQLKSRFGGIEGLPTTLLFDRQGVLRYKIIGFEYTETIESALKSLLDSHVD